MDRVEVEKMNKEIVRIMKQQNEEFERKYGYPACLAYDREELIQMAKTEWAREKDSYWNQHCEHSLDEFKTEEADLPKPRQMTWKELEDRICELIVKLSDERVRREQAEQKVEILEGQLAKLLKEKIDRDRNSNWDDPRY